MSKRLDGLGVHSKTQPVLPLTQDDLIDDDDEDQSLQQTHSQQSGDDFISIANSLKNSSNMISSFTKKQQNKLKLKSMKNSNSNSLSSSSAFKVPKYFKRFKSIKSLDFETAIWEMINLISRPKMVYKSLYYNKQTKNKWSRDDPSFVLILSFLLTISAVCWGLLYSTNVIIIFKLILYMVIVDFLLVGLIISTIGWVLANNFFLQSGSGANDLTNSNRNRLFKFIIPNNSPLEWAYCFDIHCNSYLIIWLCLYLIQFFLLPLLRLNNWISSLIGNTLYLVSLSYYFIITFYGYSSLPFLSKTEFLLVPIPIFCVIWLVLTLSGFNIANYMSNAYFN